MWRAHIFHVASLVVGSGVWNPKEVDSWLDAFFS
jgi:hypothetical protein